MGADDLTPWFEVIWVAKTETVGRFFRIGEQRYQVTGRLGHGEHSNKIHVTQLQVLSVATWINISPGSLAYKEIPARLRARGKVV